MEDNRNRRIEEAFEYLEQFPGLGLDPNFTPPEDMDWDSVGALQYMRKHGKTWEELTDKEKGMFILKK